MSFRDDLRSVFELREGPSRWPVAVQAALAIGIPTVGFALAGRPELGLLASAGAFPALYFANRSRRTRAIALPLISAGLILASAIGVLVSREAILSLVALFAVAVVATTLCLGLSVGPPGGLFFVLLTGVSANLAAPVSAGGAGFDGWLIVGMIAFGCLVAYLVVLVPLLVPQVRAADAALHASRETVRFRLDEGDWAVLLRIALASAIALAISAPLGVHRAYWVVLTVIAILQGGHHLRLTAVRAVHRVVGTFLGLGVFAIIVLIHPQGVWLGLLLMALQGVTELVVVRNYGLALIFITPLALSIASQGGALGADTVIADRAIDTVLGAAIAVLVLLVALAVQRSRGGSAQ